MVRNTSRRYPAELVWMFGEVRGAHVSCWAARAKAAELLENGTWETRPKWLRQAQIRKVPPVGDLHRRSRLR